ncbi:MAG TPA: DUF222 domain-containing protein, partial [Actinomycetota bacterium]|nr:DUF222 domain-containing protein [Actinomycetota bacterium]
MCSTIKQLRESAEKVAARLDPELVHPKDLPALLDEWSKLKKISSAMEMVIAGRVASSGNWQSEGDNSAAHFVSRTTGESVKGAVDLLKTASALKSLPKTEEAFRSGKLSPSQVSEIASAASVAPQAEEQLLKVAETDGLVGVRQAAGRVRAAACQDHVERARRLHEGRYLRTWMDSEGAFRLSGQLTPEAGSEVKAVLEAIAKDLKKKAPKETPDALAADALLQMA